LRLLEVAREVGMCCGSWTSCALTPSPAKETTTTQTRTPLYHPLIKKTSMIQKDGFIRHVHGTETQHINVRRSQYRILQLKDNNHPCLPLTAVMFNSTKKRKKNLKNRLTKAKWIHTALCRFFFAP
jgi:CRISPR/Cas system endoribonuclease Cas6 (RAMP superfamily)